MGITDNAVARKKVIDDAKKLKKEGKLYYSRLTKYVGGGAFPKVSNGVITISSNGVFFEVGLLNIIHIPFNDITKAEYLDNTQVSKDVTLTRMLLVGVFAFALKKTRKAEQFFVVINYKINGMESKIIFEDKNAMKIVSYIVKAQSENAKESQNNNCEIEAKASRVNSNKDEILELIKELAGLKEQGVLSEEEFQNKKLELLSRI